MRRILTVVAALLLVCGLEGAWTMAAPAAQSAADSAAAPKFQPAEVIATAEAAYPINSVAFGTVVLEAHLDATGAIETVTVERAIPSLTRQALEAIKQWRFKPATLGGKPVKSVVPVAFMFVRPDLVPRYGSSRAKP